jgi:DNA gyrase subunit B
MSNSSPAGDEAGPVVPNEYRAEDIQILSTLEFIRKRPGMFIGGTDLRALHGLVGELINNALHETCCASARDVHVALHADGSCRIVDAGAGLPVNVLPNDQRTVVEFLLSGSGPERTGLTGPYQPGGYRGGFYGGCSPLAVANALSEWLQIEVRRDGYLWRQEYRRGRPCEPLKSVAPSVTTGTAVTFFPDPEIFSADRQFQLPALEERLRQLAFLNPGMAFHLNDERQVPASRETYQAPNGLADAVRFLNGARAPVHPNVLLFHAPIEGGEVEVAMQWTSDEEVIQSFANDQPTPLGGTHVAGLNEGVREAVLDHWRESKELADVRPAPNGEDCRAGLTAVVSVRAQEPQFVTATRERLGNSELLAPVRRAARCYLGRFLATHPADAEAICLRVLRARNERLARRL